MSKSILINLIGLFFTLCASVIMLFSFLKSTRNIDDDYIIYNDKVGNYTQKKYVKSRQQAILAFCLYCVGFFLQSIAILLTL